MDFAERQKTSLLFLGSGSNLVLSSYLNSVVAAVCIKGKKILTESEDALLLEVNSGENWHDLVKWCTETGYYGLENLALIPGTVGAAPVQNIGAYGVEISQFIEFIRAYDVLKKSWVTLSKDQCQFGYRNSLFKQQPGRFFISSVGMKLSKRFFAQLHYGALSELQEQSSLSALDVFDRVVKIRQAKLPDPQQLPNAGSFFKNPSVPLNQFQTLKQKYPHIVGYQDGERKKLAAGWLIDQVGLRGKCDEMTQVGCYEKQALVIVNPQEQTGEDVIRWATFVADKVKATFAIDLEIEPVQW